MQLELDFQSKVPIYTQIVEHVTSLVAGNVLRTGDQLPTVREMAADLRVNFNTVARAYRLLHEARIISTQQGRGTFVLGPPPGQESARLRAQRLREMADGWLAEAQRLGYSPAEISATFTHALVSWGDGPDGLGATQPRREPGGAPGE